MPPVGDTWTQSEINALAAYVKKHIYKAAAAGATSGG
jgi:glycerol-3-phosphate O-acyltransferase